ncbi:transaldolase [Marinilabiliaceae bacterium JC017]|nr:transaldolase [Marinilabiliaceae bacterium JC017]
MQTNTCTNLLDSLLDDFKDHPFNPHPSSFWANFLKAGSRLWLDTGDIAGISHQWTSEFTALTTNNSLLNQEIQKGIYDKSIEKAGSFFKTLTPHQQIREVSLLLNMLHGLRLVRIFGGMVSVELHTDLAHDVKGIEYFGERLFRVAPKHFLIKVPFTPSGLIGARRLKEKGVNVNLTLQFSLRQNTFSAIVAKPKFTNVFLGRLGAYLKNNQLGKPDYIGEKVTIETQKSLRCYNKKGLTTSKLIAASIRNWEQLKWLSGTNVLTIPLKVAAEARQNIKAIPSSHYNELPPITLEKTVSPQQLGINKLWQVASHELDTAIAFNNKLPKTGEELEKYANDHGCRDLFPLLSQEDMITISNEGKIPIHNHWKEKISSGEMAIDTLLNLGGLTAFAKDQKAVDIRIKDILGI